MAGIGFRFRELSYSSSYLGQIKSYIYSSIFASGPWILTMLVIAVLNILAPPEVRGSDLLTFRTILSYSFAISLIITGTFQLAIVRYIADKIFEKEREEILTLYIGSTIFLALISVLVSSIIFSNCNTTPFIKIVCIMLLTTISLIFNGMAFLTAIKDYKFIIFVFISGAILTIFLGLILKVKYNLLGYLLGFFIGNLYILSGISAELVREFFTKRGAAYYFFEYFKKYFVLIVSGFSYNLGIWIDKFIVWILVPNNITLDFLKTNKEYDFSVFAAYLAIIPTIGYFFSQVETKFYELYNEYFSSILNKESLDKINERKDNICKYSDVALLNIMKLQITITLICYLNADKILKLLSGNFTSICKQIFDFSIFGVMFHIFFITITIFMMYFEFYISLAVSNVSFLILNTILTILAIKFNMNLAFGYLMATILSFIIAFLLFKININQLVTYTFINQPITPKIEEKVVFSAFEFLKKYNIKNVSKNIVEGINKDEI